MTSKKIFKWTFIFVLVGVIVWGVQWATFARPPLPEAVVALTSDPRVEVFDDPWLTFLPKESSLKTGFIFYPGGRINPQGYAPLLRAIAVEGYLVVVPTMPINMAVFNPNVADDIIAHYPDIEYWVIGGHSVGGTMAAQYTKKHPQLIQGLVIWASYPADSADLSNQNIPVVTIYGTLDPRVNNDSVAERKDLLPENAQYIRIEGGDHHQFGTYQIKPEEHFATISRDSQQQQIIQATLGLLRTVSRTDNE
jgi:dienelactone hydrolase